LNHPSRDELGAILTQTPYRLEHYGEEILAVLKNN
jgi:hypothetical protein